jgi:hypothetical protein
MKHLKDLSLVEQMQYIFEECGKTDKEALEILNKIEEKTGVKDKNIQWWLEYSHNQRIILDDELLDAYKDFVSKNGSKPTTYSKETGIPKHRFLTILTDKQASTLVEFEDMALRKFLNKHGYNLPEKGKIRDNYIKRNKKEKAV